MGCFKVKACPSSGIAVGNHKVLLELGHWYNSSLSETRLKGPLKSAFYFLGVTLHHLISQNAKCSQSTLRKYGRWSAAPFTHRVYLQKWRTFWFSSFSPLMLAYPQNPQVYGRAVTPFLTFFFIEIHPCYFSFTAISFIQSIQSNKHQCIPALRSVSPQPS